MQNKDLFTHPVLPVIFLLALLGFGCQSPEPDPAEYPCKDCHVVVIGIDGLVPTYLQKANTPVIDNLIANGAYTPRARAVLLSSSRPNWAAMLTGLSPEQSGITSNAWDRDQYILPSVALGPEHISPTIFSVIRDRNPAAETGAIYQWEGLKRMFESSVIDLDTHNDSDREVVELACSYIQKKNPDFLFIQLGHVDGIGHSKGFGSAIYQSMIAGTDSLVGQIIRAIDGGPMKGKTLILLTSDHGGLNRNHGGENPIEVEVPFLVYGPGVKKGYDLQMSIAPYDLASTVLVGLGMKQPSIWRGRPILEAFSGFDPEPWVFENLASVPVCVPEGRGYVNEIPRIRLSMASRNGEIRYTLDGTKPGRTSALYTTPILLKKSHTLKARTFTPTDSSQTQTQHYFLLHAESGHGLEASVWPIRRARTFGDVTLKPAYKDTVFQISARDMGMAGGVEKIEFEGFLEITTPGEYIFFLYSDRPSRFSIGDGAFHLGKGEKTKKENKAKVSLTKGIHKLRVTYFPGGTGRALRFMWAGPGIDKEDVPADKLFLP